MFIKYCVFSKILIYFSDSCRVQKIQNILRKNTIFNDTLYQVKVENWDEANNIIATSDLTELCCCQRSRRESPWSRRQREPPRRTGSWGWSWSGPPSQTWRQRRFCLRMVHVSFHSRQDKEDSRSDNLISIERALSIILIKPKNYFSYLPTWPLEILYFKGTAHSKKKKNIL